MDWSGWLDRVEAIEKAHPEKRIVGVQIPGGLPERGWNVENNLFRCNIRLDGGKVPNMRSGVFGTYYVTDGDFCVRFNDGTLL